MLTAARIIGGTLVEPNSDFVAFIPLLLHVQGERSVESIVLVPHFHSPRRSAISCEVGAVGEVAGGSSQHRVDRPPPHSERCKHNRQSKRNELQYNSSQAVSSSTKEV